MVSGTACLYNLAGEEQYKRAAFLTSKASCKVPGMMMSLLQTLAAKAPQEAAPAAGTEIVEAGQLQGKQPARKRRKTGSKAA